jgi:hypothetical protein
VRQVGVLRLLLCPLAVMLVLVLVMAMAMAMALRRKKDEVWGIHLKGSRVY